MTKADISLYEKMCSDDPRQVNEAARLLTQRLKGIAGRVMSRQSESSTEVADIIQDTVLDVWRQMRSGAYQPLPDTPLDAYLYRIVKNKWLKTASQSPYSTVALDHTLSDAVPEEDYRLDQLQRAFAQLDDACRKLLNKFYWEGLNTTEIADQLEISTDAAKERKYRCMIRLGKILLNNKR